MGMASVVTRKHNTQYTTPNGDDNVFPSFAHVSRTRFTMCNFQQVFIAICAEACVYVCVRARSLIAAAGNVLWEMS